jgi:hypothetical protein
MCFMTCDALLLGLLTCHPCDCCIHTPIAFSPYTQSSVYKHNEQINKQNIDNSKCFGVKYVKIYPEMTSQ